MSKGEPGLRHYQLAFEIARDAHAGQVDKACRPYFSHPIRVARSLSSPYAEVALLHDVVEDTLVTLDDLRTAGLSEEIVEAVDAITKRKGESKDDYYQRVKANPIALVVKLADVDDNADEKRLSELDPETADRLRCKYAHAREVLNG